MEQSLLAAFARYGLEGLIIFALGAWVVVLHRELRDERRARIADSKDATEVLLGMQERSLTNGAAHLEATKRLVEVYDDFKERERHDPRRRP